eukprot:CAMPEP_0194319890 /NCGR_PEP_ID=MMETSP0171-20130528/16298_1 /TAXON_ID=218684 /ORGANISM="Corethron pennatum, Strain L29A3" /LENGTH=166 /DNA_ID=CAMNT_0039077267 /DNA_START=217 /DNA_END=717 /DNA_ORIENTATION=-
MEANVNFLTGFVNLCKVTNSSVCINNEEENIDDYSVLATGPGSNFSFYENACNQSGGSFVTSSFRLKCTKDDGSFMIESVREIPSCIGQTCVGDQQGEYLGSVQIEANAEANKGSCEFYESPEEMETGSMAGSMSKSTYESAASRITSRNLVLATASISLSFLFMM